MSGYLAESDFVLVEEGFTPRDLLESLLVERCHPGEQGAFFVADLGDVVRRHLRFRKALPRLTTFFPVKCNSSREVMGLLAELGTGFACATKAEIAQVRSIGVPAERIFYCNPCKQVAHIKYAASQGVRLMTFDNEVELNKVARSHPHARMLLGVAADFSTSPHLSVTFGATLMSCRHLLEKAKEQAVDVVGISFHLGGRCLEPEAFARAAAEAQLVFEMGAELGYRMRILDIGGGFSAPGDTGAHLEETAAAINAALDLYFPEGCGVEVMARPGRYLVTSAFTFAASVTAKEELPRGQPGSEGRWGPWDGPARVSLPPEPQQHSTVSAPQTPCPGRPSFRSSLRGPAGLAEDRIADGLELPELQVGDWLLFEDMGAYTLPAAAPCRGCPQPHVSYAMSRMAW
ncbi:AZIN2 inhibitor, partial [Eudromia elegans]|nr:AZIN2 inhibitor [Eudromia elegans]